MEPTVTNIKAENAEGTQYGAEINGKFESGFRAEADGRNGAIYAAIQDAIKDGKSAEEYVEYEPTYDELRAREYPKIGDQLDAIIKELNYRRLQGDNLVEDMDAIVNACIAVKAKYPKPEEVE